MQLLRMTSKTPRNAECHCIAALIMGKFFWVEEYNFYFVSQEKCTYTTCEFAFVMNKHPCPFEILDPNIRIRAPPGNPSEH